MRCSLSLLLACCISLASSQTGEKADDYFILKPRTDSVAYTRDYPLDQGVYLKFNDFKKNIALEKEQIIMNYPKEQSDFWDQLLMNKVIHYKDDSGVEKKINVNEIWGYYINNHLYINTSEGFRKCIIIGSLCYMDRNNPTGDRPQNDTEQREIKAAPTLADAIPEKIYVFDMETNISEELDSGDLKLILARDPELLKEYSALSYKKRKQTVLLYLRKYNEKHPLYLPAK
jgi:hypothetical protein